MIDTHGIKFDISRKDCKANVIQKEIPNRQKWIKTENPANFYNE